MFKPRGAGFLNDAFRRLNCLTLKDCNSSADYITKFRALVNELRSFLLEFKVDDNFFIYKFQSNLGPDHASYFEKYAQDHDSFDANGKAKYSLSSTMQHFRNTVKNPSAKSTIGLETAATGLLSHSYASYPPLNTTQRTQKVYYKGSAPNRRIVKVKWCNFCQRANYDEEICHRKFLELAKLCAAQVFQGQPPTNPPSNPPSSQASKTSANVDDQTPIPLSQTTIPILSLFCQYPLSSIHIIWFLQTMPIFFWMLGFGTRPTPDIYAITKSFLQCLVPSRTSHQSKV